MGSSVKIVTMNFICSQRNKSNIMKRNSREDENLYNNEVSSINNHSNEPTNSSNDDIKNGPNAKRARSIEHLEKPLIQNNQKDRELEPLEKVFGRSTYFATLYEICNKLVTKQCTNEIKRLHILPLPLSIRLDLQSYAKNKGSITEVDKIVTSLIENIKEMKQFVSRFYESRSILEQNELSQGVIVRQYIQDLGIDFERTTVIMNLIEYQVMRHGKNYFLDKCNLQWDTANLEKVYLSFNGISKGLDKVKRLFNLLVKRIEALAEMFRLLRISVD